MPTFRHGRGSKVLVGAYDLSTMFREAQVNRTADTAETTAFGSTVKSYVIGMIDAGVSLSGMFSAGAGDVDPVLSQIFGQEAAVPITVMYDNPGTGSGMVAGSRLNFGQGLEASYGVSGSVGDMVAVSADVKATGGMIGGWSLLDLGATAPATANGTTVDLDNGMGQSWPLTRRFMASLHVVNNSLANTGNVAMIVEHSSASNMSGAATILTFTSITTAAGVYAEVQRQSALTTLNRYVRIRTTYTPTLTGTYSAHVGFGHYL